jgi:hypothetical protein
MPPQHSCPITWTQPPQPGHPLLAGPPPPHGGHLAAAAFRYIACQSASKWLPASYLSVLAPTKRCCCLIRSSCVGSSLLLIVPIMVVAHAVYLPSHKALSLHAAHRLSTTRARPTLRHLTAAVQPGSLARVGMGVSPAT